ncbi:MAG: putative sulfate/molybdate transporter, partial [Gemmatimonadota bacterium]
MQGRFPRFGRVLRELSGALGDSGVLAPIALALIAVNGLHPSPLFFVFGIAYAVAGFYYRLPVPVQPLKAMAVIALSTGASVGMISMAAMEMAAILILVAATGGAHLLERIFTRSLVRGIQLGVGLLLVRKAATMLFVGDGSGLLAPASGPLTLAVAVVCTVLLLLLVAHERL